MLKSLNTLFTCTLMIVAAINLQSCVTTKQVVYLNDLKDTTAGSISAAKIAFQNTIQINDQLWITVGGSNPQDLVPLNSGSGILSPTSGTSTSVGGGAIGYLVEADGTIKVPYLG